MADKYKAPRFRDEEKPIEHLEAKNEEIVQEFIPEEVIVPEAVTSTALNNVSNSYDNQNASSIDNRTSFRKATNNPSEQMTMGYNRNVPRSDMMQNRFKNQGQNGLPNNGSKIVNNKVGVGGASFTPRSNVSFQGRVDSSAAKNGLITGGQSKSTSKSNGGGIVSKSIMKKFDISKSLKIKIGICCGAAALLLFILVGLVSGKDNENLSLTSEEQGYGMDGSGNFYGGDVSTCALQVKDGVYYKTLVPQTADCQVTGFYDQNEWGLEPNFYANLNAFIESGKAHGCNASIISGHRTRERQQYFYNCYINQNCNNGNLAAAPGYSNHEFAIAADLSYYPYTNACISYYHSTAASFGLNYSVPSENWHIEPSNIVRGTP